MRESQPVFLKSPLLRTKEAGGTGNAFPPSLGPAGDLCELGLGLQRRVESGRRRPLSTRRCKPSPSSHRSPAGPREGGKAFPVPPASLVRSRGDFRKTGCDSLILTPQQLRDCDYAQVPWHSSYQNPSLMDSVFFGPLMLMIFPNKPPCNTVIPLSH